MLFAAAMLPILHVPLVRVHPVQEDEYSVKECKQTQTPEAGSRQTCSESGVLKASPDQQRSEIGRAERTMHADPKSHMQMPAILSRMRL